MPCVTRAALPASLPVTRRAALGEISGNQEGLPTAVEDPEQILKAYKALGKAKKDKASKKPKKQDGSGNNEAPSDVLADEIESETSSAVEDACQDLLREQPEGTSADANSPSHLLIRLSAQGPVK